jgi:2-keto-4-pentenoate hydratase/2-oxohepta-3-ene-1,7-dioic acid hydratase in catechol pathway
MELNKWIKPGDVVELEVEGIGILKNKVEQQT